MSRGGMRCWASKGMVVALLATPGCAFGDSSRSGTGSPSTGVSQTGLPIVPGAPGGVTAPSTLSAPPGPSQGQRGAARTQGPNDSESARLFEECRAQMASASSREEREAADRKCDAAHEASGMNGAAIASHGNLELVTARDLESWWPFRPLLSVRDSPTDGPVVFGAWTSEGGRRGRPTQPNAARIEFYAHGGSRVESSPMEEFLDSGGLVVTSYSPATQYEALPFGGTARSVEVRGHPGLLRINENTDTGSRYRRLSWREPAAERSAPVPIDIVTSASRFTDSEILGIAERLAPA